MSLKGSSTMNNCKSRTWLVVIALVGAFIAVIQVGSFNVKADDEKIEASRSQRSGRLPRIKFGRLLKQTGRLTFVQRAAFPAAPADAWVYKVQPLASKKNALLKIFKSLPLTSSPETDESLHRLEHAPESSMDKEDSASASIGGWDVKVWSGGQFLITNRELSDRLDKLGESSLVPKPQEARKAADDFLAMIGPLSLPVSFSEVEAGEYATSGGGNEPVHTVVTKLLVSYSAQIDGIPVSGGVGLYVGEGPAVVSMVSRLRHIVPDKTLPILSPQEAFEKLRAGEYNLAKGPSWNATGNVKSTKLVYWQSILAMDMSYIMPVYVFEGEAVAEGKTAKPWKAYVEAVRPEYLEVEPEDQ
jgi:hypothetical protein